MVGPKWKGSFSGHKPLWFPEMGNVPILKSKEVASILAQLGFQEVRQRGSHKQFRHQDGRFTTVPCHAGRDISPVLLRQICKDIGVTVEAFIAIR